MAEREDRLAKMRIPLKDFDPQLQGLLDRGMRGGENTSKLTKHYPLLLQRLEELWRRERESSESPDPAAVLNWLGLEEVRWQQGLYSDPKDREQPFFRLLVRLVRLGMADFALPLLNKQPQSYSDLFGPFTVPWEGSAQLLDLIAWENEHRIGRYRLLFPTHADGTGYLVRVQVTVMPRPKWLAGPQQVFLAPWSFYLAVDEEGKTSSFSDLRNNLPAALQSHLDTAVLKDVVYLLNFTPLEADDFALADPEWARIAAASLSSPELEFEGPSLGVAVALSAWAAARRVSVVPVIATGTIDAEGQIGNVHHVKQKCAGIADFLSQARIPSWKVIVPWDNRHETGTLDNVVPSVRNLAALFNDDLRLLTDGFDRLRSALGVGQQGQRKTSGEAVVVLSNDPLARARELTDAPAEAAERGFCQDDLQAAKEIGGWLLTWLQSDPKPPFRKSLAAPFDDPPQVIADWLAAHLREQWWRQMPDEELSLRPVVLPLPLSTFAELANSASAATIAGLLREGLRQRFGESAPHADDLAIALGRPHKLILLVYDQASLTLWQQEATFAGKEPLNRPTLLKVLSGLPGALAPRTPAADGLKCAPQAVVLVASDRHHQHAWETPSAVLAGDASERNR